MASYVSARFTYATLSSGKERVITYNLDQGDVPPVPSGSYFPTSPDTLRDYIVCEYTSATIGERFVRVLTLDDLEDETLEVAPLVFLRDTSVNFTTAGVAAGYVVRVTLASSSEWSSEEYPVNNPFEFTVLDVCDDNTLQVSLAFPSYQVNMQYDVVPSGSMVPVVQSVTGQTLREETLPSGPKYYRDSRFNVITDDAVAAKNLVTTMKAGLSSLVNQQNLSELVDESWTATPVAEEDD